MKSELTPEEINLRRAFGSFPTGVTIVTGLTEEKHPVGVTISSFNTVSMHPPLVLWSLVNASKNLPHFQLGKPHLIHILADDQGDVALHFAKSGIDKFETVSFENTKSGLPKLANCVTYFECITDACHQSGDHTIIISKILGVQTSDKNPLVYGRSKFIKPIF